MEDRSILQPGQGELLNVVGDQMRILVDSSQTRGRALIFETTSQPGKGPPLHRHGRDDEYFYILEGTVRFVVDGAETTISAGGFLNARRGTVHTYVNIGQGPARLLVTCCPGGLEDCFREADRLGREGRATPESLAEAFRRFELEILGPPLPA